jgi:hypothetical protein
VLVTLKGVVVTAAFKGFFYAGTPDRIGGIRVVWGASVAERTVVDVVGRMATVDGERRIIASKVAPR